MPKTSSADRINAAFKEIGKALNNPKLREGFLNGNKVNEIINELVDMFNKQRLNGATKEKKLIGKNAQSKIVKTITHVPPRVNQTSIPVTNANRPPRVSPSPVPNIRKTDRPIEHVPPQKLFNDKNTSNLSGFEPLTCSKERSNFLQSLGLKPNNSLHHTSHSESLHKTKTGSNKRSSTKPQIPALI